MATRMTGLLCALVLVAGAGAAETGADLAKPESFADRASYGVGVNMGRTLAVQAGSLIDFNLEYLIQGLRDGLGSGETLMADEELKTTLEELQQQAMAQQQQAMAQQQQAMAAAADANAKAGEEFLSSNKTRAGVTTTESGLQYEVLTTGDGAKPSASDRVTVHYTGTLIDGTVFDSSVERGTPATFPLNGVIAGWTEALQLMPVGSKWKIFLPSALAYGERGSPPRIGPNSALVFEVELLGIEGQ